MNDDEVAEAALKVRQVPTSAAAAQTRAQDDRVGYRRPPSASRFKPGQSGNPSGRPKGSRSVGAIMQSVLARKIAVTENGRTRRVSVLEGMLRRLSSDALRGDIPALKLLLQFHQRYAENGEGATSLEDMLPEDLEILARFAHRTAAVSRGDAAENRATSCPSPDEARRGDL